MLISSIMVEYGSSLPAIHLPTDAEREYLPVLRPETCSGPGRVTYDRKGWRIHDFPYSRRDRQNLHPRRRIRIPSPQYDSYPIRSVPARRDDLSRVDSTVRSSRIADILPSQTHRLDSCTPCGVEPLTRDPTRRTSDPPNF